MKSPSMRSATTATQPATTQTITTLSSIGGVLESSLSKEEEGEMHAGKGSEMHQIIILI